MIILHLAIGPGDQQKFDFFVISELTDYLKELKAFDCIWLATTEGAKEEILVTEDVDLLIKCCENGFFNMIWNDPTHFFVQEYESFESAYAVAGDMREGHPKCYDK